MIYVDDDNSFEREWENIFNSDYISLDIETTGLDPWLDRVLLVQLAYRNGSCVVNAKRVTNLFFFFEKMKEYDGLLLIQNGSFDLMFTHLYYNFLYPKKFYDTMLAQQIINGGTKKPYNLKFLSNHYLNRDIDKSITASFVGHTGSDFSSEQLSYATDDVEVLHSIAELQVKELSKSGQLKIAKIEFDVVPEVAKSKVYGIKLDTAGLLEYNKTLQATLNGLEKLFHEQAGLPYSEGAVYEVPDLFGERTSIVSKSGASINMNSPQQILKLLKGFSHELSSLEDTAEQTLIFYKHIPIVETLLAHREVSKAVSSYANKLPSMVNKVTGCLLGDWSQIGTNSGRFACEEPPLQTIPPAFRKFFVANDGYTLVGADYNQQELRAAADIFDEPILLEAYRQNIDVHKLNASSLYGVPFEKVTQEQRKSGKTLSFELIYGAYPKRIHEVHGIPYDEAQKIYDGFWGRYKNLYKNIKKAGRFGWWNGYQETRLGRKRYFDIDIPKDDPDFSRKKYKIEREGANHVIQGTSADMTKRAAKILRDKTKNLGYGDADFHVAVWVHDELQVANKNPEEFKLLLEQSMYEAGKEIMTKVDIPVEAHISKYWSKG
jgi:DNA polymerase-1